MTTSRLAIVFAVVLGGLSMSYVLILPEKVGFLPVGINLELPEAMGEWWGQKVEVTQKEKDVLGAETEFSRRQYANLRGDEIQASVVLAGQDMMTGIHRPERCMAAQGWEFPQGETKWIDVPDRGKMQVMRLKCHKQVKGADGTMNTVQSICYYWFAGSDKLTASHLKRVIADSLDRVSAGEVQRWAMMMMSATITADTSKFGRDEKATDQLLTEFVEKLAPKIHKESIRYH